MRLVNSAVYEEDNSVWEDECGLLYVNEVLLYLLEPWDNTDMIFYGSY